MKKISRAELNLLLKASHLAALELEVMHPLDVYHLHKWDHDIAFWEDDSLGNECVPMREFYFDMNEMLAFFLGYIRQLSFSQAYIAPPWGGRFIGRPYNERFAPVVSEVTAFLHARGMRINSAAALMANKQELIDSAAMLSEAGFLGMSWMHMFIPEAGIAIEPHHHMNYLIYTHEKEAQKALISEVTESLDLVRLFERDDS